MNTQNRPPLPAVKAVKVTPANDTTFLREVDEALYQDKMQDIWRRHRGLILTSVAVVAAAVAGWQGWQAYQRHQAQSLSEQYYNWSQQQDPAARQQGLSTLLRESEGGYHALAVFAQAQEAARTDPKAADRAYAQVYNDADQPQWLRELARLNAALGLLGREDTLAQEHLSLLVQVPDAAKSGPLYSISLELLTLLAQRQGDVTTARGYNERLLAIPNLPADLRQRALARRGLLGTLAS